MRKLILSTGIILFWLSVSAQNLKRVEPLSWWIGMQTPLQLMFYGDNLKDAKVTVAGKGIRVKTVHTADSPNYLFVDVEINNDATPGKYVFTLSKNGKRLRHEYLIDSRRENSALRKSFSSADMVYLLMPDRFANGDPSNDSIDTLPDKADRKDYYGRHGGDLQGIIDHLDYMTKLGATALWTTPVQLDNEPSVSYHGYACADYYLIDPRFGDNDLYKKMVGRAHEMGVKVIMDVVTNHCGTAHWWMSDPPFKNWINNPGKFIRSNGHLSVQSDPNVSKIDFQTCVKGWFDTSMPDMVTENPFVNQYFRQVYVWWVEWADLDGLRVDTYPYNEKHAMAEWTRGILNEYPEMNIVGECWSASPSIIGYWEGGAQNKDKYNSHLPSVMDFPMAHTLPVALKYDSDGWGEEINKIYNLLAEDFVYNDPTRHLIFADNHDSERLADMLCNDADRIKLALTMIATLRGTPQLYYGTELMFRSQDMEHGHGSARIDFTGGWTEDVINLFKAEQRDQLQANVFDHTAKLFNWRKSSKAVHEGKTLHFIPYKNTYSYFRHDDTKAVFVFINASSEEVNVDWNRYSEITSALDEGTSVLDGCTIKIGDSLTIKARSSIIIEFDKNKVSL